VCWVIRVGAVFRVWARRGTPQRARCPVADPFVRSLVVRFGITGTEATSQSATVEDVDGDGDTDLLLHFRTQNTGIACGDALVFLGGETFSGQAIEASDSIRTVGCR